MLQLPAELRMRGARQAWAELSRALVAEAAQVKAGAGTELRLSAAPLAEFDSSALSLMLSAARLCTEQGLTLRLDGVPPKLLELARVYGVADLLCPSPDAGVQPA